MALSAFGKDLARRSKSKCELTGASGIPLHIYEIPPVADEPQLSRCIMICEQAIDQIKQPSLIIADQWRHLGELIWSDTPAIQIMAYRLLKYISHRDQWARDILEEAYLDEAVIAEADKEAL